MGLRQHGTLSPWDFGPWEIGPKGDWLHGTFAPLEIGHKGGSLLTIQCNSHLPGTALQEPLDGDDMVPFIMVTGNTLQLKFAVGSVKPLGHRQLLAPVSPRWPLLAPAGSVGPNWPQLAPVSRWWPLVAPFSPFQPLLGRQLGHKLWCWTKYEQ